MTNQHFAKRCQMLAKVAHFPASRLSHGGTRSRTERFHLVLTECLCLFLHSGGKRGRGTLVKKNAVPRGPGGTPGRKAALRSEPPATGPGCTWVSAKASGLGGGPPTLGPPIGGLVRRSDQPRNSSMMPVNTRPRTCHSYANLAISRSR